MRVLFLSIVPSPYQRDFFSALNEEAEIELKVLYAAAGIPDSPWPEESLRPFEEVTPSFNIGWKGKRFIVNRQLPSVSGYDVVVLNGYATLPAQWILRTACRKIPVLFWGEKLEHGQGGIRELMQGILTRPMRHLAGIVAIGRKASRDYRRLYPGKPVYEVPYYCSLMEFQNAVRPKEGPPSKILFCGQMIPRKGVDLLLEAFSQIIQAGIEAQLILVGWEQELPRMLNEVSPDVRERIRYEGFKRTDELPALFAEADIFVLPSRYDGWGVVVNQALGAGLPVVCSDAVGSAEDLVEPGGNGFIFKNGNVDELETAFKTLLTDGDLTRRFSVKSAERGHEITPKQGARDWIKLLREVLDRKDARSQ